MDGRDKFGSFENRTGTPPASSSASDTTRVCGSTIRLRRRPRRQRRPAAPANRPPTVVARCEPCTVEVGKASTVTADATDPDGDTLTYKWSAPTGSLTNATARQTPWTCPAQEGPVQLTVQVSDGKGGTASANVTIQCIRPAVKEVVFEDVHFDFDRYSLRPEATRALDEGDQVAAGQCAAPDRDRRPHLQHRHGRIQPGARRAQGECRERLPHQPRYRSRQTSNGELRRGAAEARQLA